MRPKSLIHATRKLEHLQSIIEHGFAYNWNDTEVTKKLIEFGFIKIQNPGGMICFTERSLAELDIDDYPFGRYGVCLNTEWVVSEGARKVEYIDDIEMEKLRSWFKDNTPYLSFPDAGDQRADIEQWVRELTFTQKGFAASTQSESFSAKISELDWMQTARHRDEAEWRIRSPRQDNIYSETTVAERISWTQNITGIAQYILLHFYPDIVEFFFCPPSDLLELRQVLDQSAFRECGIRTTRD